MERKDAIEKGLPRYYTGRACKHGHKAERLTVSGGCVVCVVRLKTADRERAQAAMKAAGNC